MSSKNPKKKPPPSANSKLKPPPSKSQPAQVNPINLKKPGLPTNPKLMVMEGLNNAIHEYLLKNNYLKTLLCFQEDLLKNYSVNRSLQASPGEAASIEESMIDAFETGNRDLFYEKWNSFVPINVRFEDVNCCKLEFYLQIYFLIYPIHPLFKKSQFLDKNTVMKYKKYLETKGSELSKTSEFLPYYALPYIQKPQEHPALKELFTKEWIVNLRLKLLEFLSNLFNSEEVPFLYQIFQYYQSSKPQGMNISPGSQEPLENRERHIQQLEANNKELVTVIQDFNAKYTQMQRNYKQFAESAKANLLESQNKWSAVAKELVSISKELIIGIENLRSGTAINEKKLAVLVNKTMKYEKFLNTNLEDLISQSQDVSLFDKASTINENEKYSDLGVSPIPQQDNTQYFKDLPVEQVISQKNLAPPVFEALNFEKIKEVFSKIEQPEFVCAVLQALRWRITRSKNSLRREVIMNYAVNDILGCGDESGLIQENLISKSDQKIKEFSMRLINALASDYYGRSYLVSNDKTVIRLMGILISEKGDTLVRRNTLGSLQKLSLRKKPQITMIENGLIVWIVKTLKSEKDTLSEYSIEYTTALFMNLSLRSAGKTKCEDPKVIYVLIGFLKIEKKSDVLSVLNELLEHENMQVRTFVNGTLYSLFSRPTIREQAKAIGMMDILKYLMENSDERFTKQIQYIMDQLSQEPSKENMDKSQALSESNDEENDVDDLDEDEDLVEEEELEESIHLDQGIPLGEDLLAKYFALPLEAANKQNFLIKGIVQEQQKSLNVSRIQEKSHDNQNMFKRPTTPSLISNNPSSIDMHGTNNTNNREMPSEMKARPKILRTPAEASVKKPIAETINNNNNSLINEKNDGDSLLEDSKQYNKAVVYMESPFMDIKKIELRKKAETSEEYKQAFESRNRIVRTPPSKY